MAASHAKGYLELSDRLTVTAACDLILERAQAAATELGTAQAFERYQDLSPPLPYPCRQTPFPKNNVFPRCSRNWLTPPNRKKRSAYVRPVAPAAQASHNSKQTPLIQFLYTAIVQSCEIFPSPSE